MTQDEWNSLHPFILELEERGVVTRTFRRLDLDRQIAVVQAILMQAGAEGPAALTMKGVAEASGVAVGSLYQYFGSRENLMEFATEMVVRTTVREFESYQDELNQLPLADGLGAYLMGGIEWTEEQRAFARFFAFAAYRGESDPQQVERMVEPIGGAMQGMVRSMLAAARERGELRAEIDFEGMVRAVNILLIAVGDAQLMPHLNSYYQAIDPEVQPQRLVAAMLDLIQNGIITRSSSENV